MCSAIHAALGAKKNIAGLYAPLELNISLYVF